MQERVQEDHVGRRITKNSALLMVRTVLIMLVSLVTVRITLQVLGQEDYGIYSLVAGFVLFFGLLNISMERATSRFLLYEEGKGDELSTMRVFNVAVYAHASISLAILLLGETVGLWYVNTQLIIPTGKMAATNWVYQLALASTICHVMKVPYNASIVAYERMSFYAYLAMGEVVLRLAAIMMLYLFNDHLLTIYALQWFIVSLTVFFCYKIYCRRNFPICRFRFLWDKKIYMNMLVFSGWSTLGGAAGIFALQGVSLLLNRFIGVLANAALGIAIQVYNAMFSILNSIQTAFSPRLVGLYARGELDKLRQFIYSLGKYSFYAGAILTVPVCINMSVLLSIWLGKDLPQYSAIFSILILCANFIDCIAAPGLVCNQATGRVSNFNIIWSLLLLSNLPLSYIVLKLHTVVPSVFIIRVIVSFAIFIFMAIVMHRQIQLSARRYIMKSLVYPLLLSLPAVAIATTVAIYLTGITAVVLSTLTFWLLFGAIIVIFGLNNDERIAAKSFVINKMPLCRKKIM